MSDTSFIRPSILPKLQHCGHYRSQTSAGAAADRGNRVDKIFRFLLSGKGEADPRLGADPEEVERAEWAAATARQYAFGSPVDATEEGCAIEFDLGIGRPVTGTADAVVPEQQVSFDLKSGLIRDYLAQQAIYAGGFMDRYFCDEWTVRLLYCDERQVISYKFTRNSVERIGQDALRLWRSNEAPRLNDYCGWCANQFTCEARKREVGTWLEASKISTAVDKDILKAATTDALVSFLVLAKSAEDWVTEARRILRERIDVGEKPAGVKLVSKRGSRKVEPISLLGLADPATILRACAPIPEAAAKEMFPDLLENLVIEAPGRVEMHVSKPKPPKADKQLTLPQSNPDTQ